MRVLGLRRKIHPWARITAAPRSAGGWASGSVSAGLILCRPGGSFLAPVASGDSGVLPGAPAPACPPWPLAVCVSSGVPTGGRPTPLHHGLW